MKTLIIGNSGSGKTTLARRLADAEDATCLSLDELAFEVGAKRLPLEVSVKQGRAFLRKQADVVVEGCYADIAGGLSEEFDRMIFLNPGTEACLANCRARPWEPDKYETRAAQDAMLENLMEWVATYDERDDEYGLRAHRALFDSFTKPKVELLRLSGYEQDLRAAFGG